MLRLKTFKQPFSQCTITCKSEVMPVIQPELECNTAISDHSVGKSANPCVHLDEVGALFQPVIKHVCLGAKPFADILVCVADLWSHVFNF